MSCTVSQLAIEKPCQPEDNPVHTNTSPYPLSQGSAPKYLHINQNVIPHKCTSKSCQTLNKTSNQACQISTQTTSQYVQVAVSKLHISTQCYPVEFSKYKGISRYIHDKKYWENFINFLDKHNQLKDFTSLTRGLHTSRIDPNNLSWMSALHMGRYSNCPSTTGMRYDTSLMEFYQLYYLLFRSCVLNVLRGPTHFSNVVTRSCRKGQYDPTSSRINFPIPSLPAMKK